MFSFKPLAYIVVLSALSESSFALAQEATSHTTASADDKLDPVVVIGTRRSDVTALESAAPVDVISSDQLQQSGAATLGQALAGLLPSFSFPQNVNGAFAQEVPAGVSLRGLGSDQVLVLVNGKRRHTGSTVTRQNYSAKGGVPVDISLFPLDAIERVEVLRDGASAQYGSDAIAGVINIVLKGVDEGGKLGYRLGEYKKGDGLSRKLGGYKGFALPGDGFLTVSFDAGEAAPANDTNPDNRVPETNPLRNWRFGVGNVSDQYNLVLNSEASLTDKLSAYGFATWAHKNSDAEASLVLPSDRRNIASVYPQGYWPITRYRLEDYAGTGGLRFEDDNLGKFDLSANYGRNEVESKYYDTLNASWGPSSPTRFDTGTRINSQANLSLDWVKDVAVEGLYGPLTLSSGVAYRWEEYELQAGEAAASENRWYPHPAGGYYTPASSGITPVDAGTISRNVFGGYVDIEAQITERFQSGIALRSEHYNDFGDTTNGKFSARYDFTPQVAIRGSLSTGYRAPSLVQAGYQASGIQIVQTGSVYDTVLQRTLRADSPIAAALGGKALKPEKSENISLGLVLRPLPEASVTLDVYRIDIADRITPSENLTGADVVSALTAAGITGVNSATFFTNVLDTRTKGVELAGKYRFTFELGTLDLSAGFARTETEVTDARDVGRFNTSRIMGRTAIGVIEDNVPKTKFTWGLRYAFNGFEANFNQRRYGEYTTRGTTDSADQTFSAQWISDLDLSYRFAQGLRVAVGAQNLFDSHPDKLASTGSGPYGIAKYSTVSPEGHQGAFYYTSVSYDF